MIKSKINKPTIFMAEFIPLIKLFRITNTRISSFIFVTFLSLIAALFEGICIALMIPTVKGIINMDFSFVRTLPIAKNVINFFPQMFTTKNSSIFIMLIISIVIAGVMKNVFLYLTQLLISYRAQTFAHELRMLLFSRYLSFGKLFYDRTNAGYLNGVLVNFTAGIARVINLFQSLVTSICMLLVYFIVMCLISVKVTLAVLIFSPLYFLATQGLIARIGKTAVYCSNSRSELFKSLFNVLSCHTLINLYTSEKKEKEKFYNNSATVKKWQLSIDKKQFLVAPLQDSATIIGLMLLLSVTALVVIKENIRDIAPFLILFYVIKKAMFHFGPINQFRASVASVKGESLAILEMMTDSDKFQVEEGQKELLALKKSIEYRNLNFSYVKDLDVLRDVTFSIEKDKMIAIVGPTGSGKSTLVNLLLRFYDCEQGSIFIDGVDIKEFTLKSLRNQIAFVSQDTLLFNASIKDNIIYGLDNVSNEELISATKRARLYNFVMKLPRRFDTLIGDNGVRLSGGEKQRLSIARALLKKANILILDEATSSLDTKTEKLIQEAVEETVKGRTTIVIAHRLSTIRNADKVVVIEDGKLIEKGLFKELLDKKGKFYKYWEGQKFY